MAQIITDKNGTEYRNDVPRTEKVECKEGGTMNRKQEKEMGNTTGKIVQKVDKVLEKLKVEGAVFKTSALPDGTVCEISRKIYFIREDDYVDLFYEITSPSHYIVLATQADMRDVLRNWIVCGVNLEYSHSIRMPVVFFDTVEEMEDYANYRKVMLSKRKKKQPEIPPQYLDIGETYSITGTAIQDLCICRTDCSRYKISSASMPVANKNFNTVAEVVEMMKGVRPLGIYISPKEQTEVKSGEEEQSPLIISLQDLKEMKLGRMYSANSMVMPDLTVTKWRTRISKGITDVWYTYSESDADYSFCFYTAMELFNFLLRVEKGGCPFVFDEDPIPYFLNVQRMEMNDVYRVVDGKECGFLLQKTRFEHPLDDTQDRPLFLRINENTGEVDWLEVPEAQQFILDFYSACLNGMPERIDEEEMQ